MCPFNGNLIGEDCHNVNIPARKIFKTNFVSFSRNYQKLHIQVFNQHCSTSVNLKRLSTLFVGKVLCIGHIMGRRICKLSRCSLFPRKTNPLFFYFTSCISSIEVKYDIYLLLKCYPTTNFCHGFHAMET